MSMTQLVIGTRGSALALWQTEHVAAQLKAAVPDLDLSIQEIKTQGDRVRNVPLFMMQDRGFFVKEIEHALLSGQVNLAVHSLKDVPTELPAGLTFGAILERANPHDALIARHGSGPLSVLEQGARIGTSSLRRRAQLLAYRSDLQMVDLRGNVDTRLRKLHNGEYDAIVLATAGLARLGLDDQVTQQLPFEVMLPAPGQGALALECRAADTPTRSVLRALHHRPTWAATTAERAFLHGLSAGCSAPVAAYAVEQLQDGTTVLQLFGLVASLDGRQVVRVTGTGDPGDPAQLGYRLAHEALQRGGSAILEAIL